MPRALALALAAALCAPLSASAQSINDFTVTGSGGALNDFPLPHPLHEGRYELTIQSNGRAAYLVLRSFNDGLRCEGAPFPGLHRHQLNIVSTKPFLARITVGYRFSGANICPGAADISSSGTDSEHRYSVRFRRLGEQIDEPNPAPDPTPEPPPTFGPCTPTTDVLDLDGYRVRMCYETQSGDVGQAKAGIWSSGESGLLWFFNRDNAEALVKVLDGCQINDYRWVFVAPVTTLGLSLRITAPDGRTWDYTSSTGTTALSRSDTRAFRCQ